MVCIISTHDVLALPCNDSLDVSMGEGDMNFPIVINEFMELVSWISIGIGTGLIIFLPLGFIICIHTKKLPRHAKIAIERVSTLSRQLRAQGDELGREKAKVADYKAGIASNGIIKGQVIAFLEKIV